MKRFMKMFDFLDGYNSLLGSIVAFLSLIFGEHWVLFALFLFLNIIDWLTGWLKSNIQHKTNSCKGWQGVLKKLGYWLMIAFAFGLSVGFIEIGETIGADLSFTTLLGWFVLASLTINEARSIVENFVEAGYDVPKTLVNGLEIADKLVNQTEEESN